MLPSLSSLPLVGAPGRSSATTPSRDATSDLSDDLLGEIMAYIENGTIGYMCQTSHRVRAICRDPALWKALCAREGYGAPPTGVPWMYHYARNANPAYARRADLDLIDAASDGDLARMQELFAGGADVHAQDDEALWKASAGGHAEVVQLLLAAGADVHAQDDEALQWASEVGRVEVVRLLLAAGADVHAQDDAALQSASIEGHAGVVQVLLAAGADVHASDDAALWWALFDGHLALVQLLLAGGANALARHGHLLELPDNHPAPLRQQLAAALGYERGQSPVLVWRGS